jgi:hypothetical protein
VAWFERFLQSRREEPLEPKRLAEIRNGPQWASAGLSG